MHSAFILTLHVLLYSDWYGYMCAISLTLSPSELLEIVGQACVLKCNGVIFHILINTAVLISEWSSDY